jgi:hypothetical protein
MRTSPFSVLSAGHKPAILLAAYITASQSFAACGETDKIRFFYRHAREKKHFSAHKCASKASAR